MNVKQTLSDELKEFFDHHEIFIENFAKYTSEQNEDIERADAIIVIRFRALEIEADLSIFLWLESTKTCVYLGNRTSVQSLDWKFSVRFLYEFLRAREDDVSSALSLTHLKIFECRVYFHILEKKRSKLAKAQFACSHWLSSCIRFFQYF